MEQDMSGNWLQGLPIGLTACKRMRHSLERRPYTSGAQEQNMP
jgi:hypothetical protein